MCLWETPPLARSSKTGTSGVPSSSASSSPCTLLLTQHSLREVPRRGRLERHLRHGVLRSVGGGCVRDAQRAAAGRPDVDSTLTLSSFFHSVCTLGYSLVPMNAAAIFISFFSDFVAFWINFLITGIAFFWSVKSAALYIAPVIDAESRGLALYPVILFYLFLALFILNVAMA